jgi:hypothetical protein
MQKSQITAITSTPRLVVIHRTSKEFVVLIAVTARTTTTRLRPVESEIDLSATGNTLIEQAAVLLGASERDAQQIREEGSLAAEGMQVLLMNVPPVHGVPAGIMLGVDTGRPITDRAAQVLLSTPGLLHLRGAALGATEQATWALYRFVSLDNLSADGLAAEIVAVRRIADIALDAESLS